jgi:hypothetical protein
MTILAEFSDSYCQQDAGRMLLEHPTLDFKGATLVLTEEERPVPMASKGRGRGRGRGRGTLGTSSTRPREGSGMNDRGRGRGHVASRPGLGMQSRRRNDEAADWEPTEQSAVPASTAAPKSQADFRKMLGI